ncbi:MAG: DUF6485 family protein [Candidatus Omnitrophota bacterium]
MDCKLQINKKRCHCTYEPCARKGNCCDCLHYHRANGELPACFFSPDAEKTYDRSIQHFMQTYREKGSRA